MRHRFRIALSCLLAAAGAAAAAAPPPPPVPPPPVAPIAIAPDVQPAPADIDRLTDAVLAMMPIGKLFDEEAAADPAWPLQGSVKNVTPDQLACTRSELSTPGYRRSKRAEIEQYAKAHPSHVHADITLLESGASLVFGRLMQAGVDKAKAHSEEPIDPAKALEGVTNEQVLSFITFTNDPDYADLRRVIGMGDALSAANAQDESENKGRQVGATIAARLMIQAMGTCHVPPTAYMH
jgi:hypothetical protein